MIGLALGHAGKAKTASHSMQVNLIIETELPQLAWPALGDLQALSWFQRRQALHFGG